ncbi:hypothetical protein CARUB_v10002599mg [Capsella rubella]|uniref:Histone deacetylase interacting domain-containing protein n=1 Tax=Capsella rubella TaxID=81985 RepID=R0GYT3_9BRAS|nr:hypothetical protein CARUB_v10002599mg [Capsella rubella]
MAGGSKPVPTKDDAHAYLKAVSDHFHNDRKKYEDFVALLIKFKAHKIDREDVIRGVRVLLNGQPNLVSGFNAFLPEWLYISVPFRFSKKTNN